MIIKCFKKSIFNFIPLYLLVGVISRMSKKHHVQRRLFGKVRTVRLRARYFSISLKWPQLPSKKEEEMDLIFFMAFYEQFEAPCQIDLVFDKFCIFWSFLSKRRPIKWSNMWQLTYGVGNC